MRELTVFLTNHRAASRRRDIKRFRPPAISAEVLSLEVRALQSGTLPVATGDDGPEVTPGDNVKSGLIGTILALGGVDEDLKLSILDQKGTTLTKTDNTPHPDTHIAVDAGHYKIIDKLPSGFSAGSTGAASCIGVVIVYPTGQVCIYHFYNDENPASTMFQTKPAEYPSGTKALIFGGDNSDPSNFTLASVVNYFDAHQVGFQYSDTTGGNVDSNGNFFLYQHDGLKP